MATAGTNNENSILFLSNFEGEPLKINLKMASETSNNSWLLSWMDKNRNRLLGVLAVVALSVAINCAILQVVLSSFGKGETFVQLQPRVDSNQSETGKFCLYFNNPKLILCDDENRNRFRLLFLFLLLLVLLP